MWFPKFPYTNFSQINLDWVIKQVKDLSEWMNRYFKDIRQDLDDEINNRIEGDKALGERIDQEITDRTEADQQLQDNIDAEEAAREAADTALGERIDKEIQDRTAADTALGVRIDQEIQDRTNADTALGQRIDTETSERKAADQQLQSNIDALRSDAILKDGSTTTTASIPFAQGIKTGSIAELSPDAGVSIEAQLDMNSHKITALADGSDDADAVNVGQMNTADDQAVQEAVEEANSYTDSQLESFAADVHSIPAGGASGQVLAKVDGTNYNVTWVDQQGGGSGGDVPAGGTTGQVLAKSTDADYQTEWVNPPEGLPAGGTTGQVVTKTAEGAEWADAPSGLPEGGTTGQVLAKVDGTNYNAQWTDVWETIESDENYKIIQSGKNFRMVTTQALTVGKFELGSETTVLTNIEFPKYTGVKGPQINLLSMLPIRGDKSDTNKAIAFAVIEYLYANKTINGCGLLMSQINLGVTALISSNTVLFEW